jgi:hypothetical protein
VSLGDFFVCKGGFIDPFIVLYSMNKKFQELRMSTGKDPTSLTVNVLSQGQWPP